NVQTSDRERVKLSRVRKNTHYNSGATDNHFKKDDIVWVCNPKRRRGLSPKPRQKCEGPYTIFKKLNDVVFRVQKSPNAKPKIIHINRLVPYWTTDHIFVYTVNRWRYEKHEPPSPHKGGITRTRSRETVFTGGLPDKQVTLHRADHPITTCGAELCGSSDQSESGNWFAEYALFTFEFAADC
ncbi:hypothetical protein AVEN_65580-1, partial [Araneus ventricosus]